MKKHIYLSCSSVYKAEDTDMAGHKLVDNK